MLKERPQLQIGDGIIFFFRGERKQAVIISAGSEGNSSFNAADYQGYQYLFLIEGLVTQVFRGGILIWSISE